MNKEFGQKIIDEEGLEILNVIANADRFNKWMYSRIAPYCYGNILEIGSGIGNISSYFLQNGSDITLSDLRDNYTDILKNKFKQYSNLKGIITLDLVDADFENKYSHLLGTFDTVYALNVVEHIGNDELAIANCKKLLKEHGNIVILVPAYQFLYNRFDKELEHFRRYTKKTLNALFEKNNLEVIKSSYFNLGGILGWFMFGKLLNKKTIEGEQMSLYNKLVPFFKIADKLTFNLVGLSVISIAKK